MEIELVNADYSNSQHATDIVLLLDRYAQDPMGGGAPLEERVKENLVAELAKISQAFSVIAYADKKPAGLINCFEAFSTFQCKPLVNIHDVVVLSEFRGLSISQRMLESVEQIAIDKGCCKITLEVLQGNPVAKSAYKKYGFTDYVLDPKMGGAVFWQKPLNDD